VLPLKIRELIARMALENPTWSQGRIAADLSLKLGILLSPRTVRKYRPWEPSDCRGRRISKQQMDNIRAQSRQRDNRQRLPGGGDRPRPLSLCTHHSGTGFAADSALQCDCHPTAEWTAQQFREAIPSEHRYRFLIHDRDSIFSAEFDHELAQGVFVNSLRCQIPF